MAAVGCHGGDCELQGAGWESSAQAMSWLSLTHIPAEAQIRNSNASQLMAQVARAGAIGKYYGIAADDEASIARLLKAAVEENDVVLISGGVSFGDFDFVPSVMRSLGLTIHFDQVAMQPGKPLTFCTGEREGRLRPAG